VLAFHDWMGDAANYEPLRPLLNLHTYTYVFADLRGYPTYAIETYTRATDRRLSYDARAAETVLTRRDR
jgi:hypothetical protein